MDATCVRVGRRTITFPSHFCYHISVLPCFRRLQNSPYFCVFKHALAVKQKVGNEAENRERDWRETVFFLSPILSPHTPYGRVRLARFARVRLLRHALSRESKKETGKGGKILVTSNEGKSKKEKGKGDKISLKSNWRMNEREQDKIDAELATSGEERSEKQQSKKGVD